MRKTILAGLVLVLAGCINQEEYSEEYILKGRMLVEWLRDLRSDDPADKISAHEALQTIGPQDKEALPALVRALNDPEPFVRASCVEALGRMGASARKAERAVAKLIDDRDNPMVMKAAINAYNAILRGQLAASGIKGEEPKPD